MKGLWRSAAPTDIGRKPLAAIRAMRCGIALAAGLLAVSAGGEGRAANEWPPLEPGAYFDPEYPCSEHIRVLPNGEVEIRSDNYFAFDGRAFSAYEEACDAVSSKRTARGYRVRVACVSGEDSYNRTLEVQVLERRSMMIRDVDQKWPASKWRMCPEK